MERPLIRGDTRLVALLGDPVAHSLSPVIHNHAFARLNLPFVYLPLRVSRADLHRALALLRDSRFAGANITIPHKQSALPYCDRISDLSHLTGTVNTLYFDKSILWGTTTDAEGFFRALAWMGHDIAGGSTVLVGNGGTARTLGFALAKTGKPARLSLVGRDLSRVAALAGEIAEKTGFPVDYRQLDDPEARTCIGQCSLLVNCTPVGMHPHADALPVPLDLLRNTMTVFDTIYNPSTTRLLSLAQQAGCKTQNGMRMLLYQGLASFKLWTGCEADEGLFDIQELEALVTHADMRSGK
jgi:shikimate dehydrogenase